MEILIPRPLCNDDTTIALGLSQAEVEALEAAGRAAGLSDLRSTVLAVVNDALDAGFRTMREQSDKCADAKESAGELIQLISEIAPGEAPETYIEAVKCGFSAGCSENFERGPRRLREAAALAKRAGTTDPILTGFAAGFIAAAEAAEFGPDGYNALMHSRASAGVQAA